MTDKDERELEEDARTVEETSAVGGVLDGSFDHTSNRISNRDDEASPVEEVAREKDVAREEG